MRNKFVPKLTKEERFEKFKREHPDWKPMQKRIRKRRKPPTIVPKPMQVGVPDKTRKFFFGGTPTQDFWDMLDLRREGWSFNRLAAKYNCDHTTLIYHCKKHGVEPGQDKQSFNKFASKDTLAELKDLTEKEWTATQIAAKFNVSVSTVYIYCRKHGFKLKKGKRPIATMPAFVPERSEPKNEGKATYEEYVKADKPHEKRIEGAGVKSLLMVSATLQANKA